MIYVKNSESYATLEGVLIVRRIAFVMIYTHKQRFLNALKRKSLKALKNQQARLRERLAFKPVSFYSTLELLDAVNEEIRERIH